MTLTWWTTSKLVYRLLPWRGSKICKLLHDNWGPVCKNQWRATLERCLIKLWKLWISRPRILTSLLMPVKESRISKLLIIRGRREALVANASLRLSRSSPTTMSSNPSKANLSIRDSHSLQNLIKSKSMHFPLRVKMLAAGIPFTENTWCLERWARETMRPSTQIKWINHSSHITSPVSWRYRLFKFKIWTSI